MKLRRRGFASIVMMFLTGGLLLAAVTTAHDKSYKSTVSIALTKASQDDYASGEVDSSKKGCRKGRTVVLFEEGKGGVTGQFIEVGRTKSGAGGAWTVPIPNGIKKGLAYHAEVKTEKLRNTSEHKHICKPKFSEDVLGS